MLEELKQMLDIGDESLDNKLKLIIKTATARLKALLGGIDPPDSLSYIILEVSIMRFNRIGSEGLKSHSVEGESLSFADSDFDQFAGDIQTYLESQQNGVKGRLRFI